MASPGVKDQQCNSRTTLSTDEVHDALAQPRAPFSASAFPVSFQPSGCPPEIDSLNVFNLPSVAKRKAAACRSGRIAVFEGADRIRLSSHARHLSWPHCQLCFTVVFAYFLCAVEAFSLQSSTSHFPASEPPWAWDIFDDKFFPFPPFFDSSVSSTPHAASSPCQRHFLDLYRRHRHRQGTRRCHPSSMPRPYSSRSSSWKCRPCPPHLKANHQHLRIGRNRQHLSHT